MKSPEKDVHWNWIVSIYLEDVAGWLSLANEPEESRKGDKCHCIAKWYIGGEGIEFDFLQYSVEEDEKLLATTRKINHKDIVPRYSYLSEDDLEKAIEFELQQNNM